MFDPRQLPPQSVRHPLVVPRDDRDCCSCPSAVRAHHAVADLPRPDTRSALVRPVRVRDAADTLPGVLWRAGCSPKWAASPAVVAPIRPGDLTVRALTVQDGVSHHHVWLSPGSASLGFTLIYAVLAVIWFYLLRRYISEGPL